MRNRVFAMVLSSMVLGGLSGCGASGADDGNVPVAMPRQGTIRVVNVMPDAGRMTSFLSNTLFGASQFGESTALAPEAGRAVRDEHSADAAERCGDYAREQRTDQPHGPG